MKAPPPTCFPAPVWIYFPGRATLSTGPNLRSFHELRWDEAGYISLYQVRLRTIMLSSYRVLLQCETGWAMQQSASNNGSVDESSEPRDWPGDRHPTRWDVHDANKLPETRFLQRFKTALLHSEDALNCKQLMTQLGHENDDPSLLTSHFGEAADSVSAEITQPLIPFSLH